MRELLKIAAVLTLPFVASAQVPVSYSGGTYTQDFDSMGTTGTNTPPGWFVGLGTNANVQGPLSIGNGSVGPTPGIPGWNYGSAGATDRSLGTASTGTDRVLELRIINNSGVDINAFELRFDGEMWRTAAGNGTGSGNPYSSVGASSALDNYVVLISTNNGTNFTPLGSQFIYTVPRNTPYSTQTDGKAATNRVAGIGGSYALASPVPNGGGIRLKWFDYNLVGPSDADIAIDNVMFRASTLAPVSVTRNPQSTSGVQCGMVSFSVEVLGSSPVIQWQKSTGGGAFEDLVGATGLSLVVSNLVFPDDNNTQFRAHVSNSLNATDSEAANLTVEPDTTPPTVVRALGENDLTSFTVTYSEAMEATSVVNQSAYQIRSQDGLDVLTIVSIVPTTPTTIIITTSTGRDPNKNYILAVNETGTSPTEACNVNNVIAPNTMVPVTASFEVLPLVGAAWRYLDNSAELGSSDIWAAPGYDDSTWPIGTPIFDWKNSGVRATMGGLPVGTTLAGTNPDGRLTTNVYFRTPFALPGPAAGASLAIRVIVDGGYVLYVNGMEAHRLRVPAAQTAATYATAGPPDANTDGDGDIEGPFLLNVTNLVNGVNELAVELHQDGNGSSDLDFALQLNAQVTNVFSGAVTFVQQPQSSTVNEGQSAGFSVAVEGSPPITFQWQKSTGGGPFLDLDGQTGGSLVFGAATPVDTGDYRVIASNSFGPVTSGTATLAVNADLTQPTLLTAAGGTNPATVNLTFSRAISAATGGNTANYTLAPVGGGAALTIMSATVNGANIELTTTPRVFGSAYQLTVRDLRDTTFTGNLLNPNPTVVNPLPQDILLLGYMTSPWRYNTNCQDGINWNASGFDDSSWPMGLGFFGLETTAATFNLLPAGTNSIQTTQQVSTLLLPYYYRTTFPWPYDTCGVVFLLNHYIDDGAVFYVNGAVTVLYGNTPTNPIPPTCTSLFFQPPGGDAALVHTNLHGVSSGQNTLAVEVHQSGPGSSDILFGAELIARVTSFGAARPRLTISDAGNNTVRITWTPVQGTLQFKNNLEDPNWTDVPAQTAGNTVVPRDQLKRFYNLRQ